MGCVGARNSPHKKASIGCVRETPQIKRCLSLVTGFFNYFFTTFVGLLPVRVFVCLFVCLFVLFLFVFVCFCFVFVFCFFPFLLCGHFSLSSCSVLFCSVLFRVLEGSLLSSEWAFFKLFSKLFVLSNCVDFLIWFFIFYFFSTFVVLPSDRVFLFYLLFSVAIFFRRNLCQDKAQVDVTIKIKIKITQFFFDVVCSVLFRVL